MDRVRRWLIVAYVLLLPVSWSPFPSNIQWSEVVFVLLLTTIALRRDATIGPLRVLDFCVVLYLAGSLPSLLTTPDLRHSLVNFSKQLYLALVYFTAASLMRSRDQMRLVATSLAWSGAIAAAAGAIGVLGYYALSMPLTWLGIVNEMPYVGSSFRPYGTTLSAAFLANYLTFTVPFLMGFTMAERPSARLAAACAAALAVVVAALTLSPSFGGLLVAMTAFVAATTSGSIKVPARLAFAAALLIALALNAMTLVTIREARISIDRDAAIGPPAYAHGIQAAAGADRVTATVSYNPVSYLLLKRIAWRAFRHAPWTGIGLGAFQRETERAYREGTLPFNYRTMDPHSMLLGRLAETGIVGGISLALLWVGVLVIALSGVPAAAGTWWHRAALCGALGLLINSVNVDIMNFRFLWLGLAVVRTRQQH